MKVNYLFLLFIGLSMGSAAQTDTSRKSNTIGNRNVQVTTNSRSNVPANQRSTAQSQYRPTNPGADNPDVLLDVPHLSIDTLVIEVDSLYAHLALDARVASLVKLTAGVDIGINRVSIRLKGVDASALLVVRLDNVRAIIERTLQTLDNNPQLVDRLLQSVDNTVNTVGNVANTALQPGGVISQTVNTLGQTVQRTLDAAGNIIEKTLDTTGKVISSKTAGRVLDLPVVSQTTNAAGQVVKKVRDVSGQIIEVVTDSAGKIIRTSMVTGNMQGQ